MKSYIKIGEHYINLDKLECVAGCTFKYPNRFCLLRVSGADFGTEFASDDDLNSFLSILKDRGFVESDWFIVHPKSISAVHGKDGGYLYTGSGSLSCEFQEQDETTKLIKSLTITEVNATATWQE